MIHSIQVVRRLALLGALVLLAACGATTTDSAPAPAAEATAQPVTTVAREAECAFPATMRVGQPATIRFSLFAPGGQPDALPGATAEIEPLELPQRPGLETWVSVSLTANGVPVVQADPSRQLQRMSEQRNIWIWQLTPTDTEPLVLQPSLDLEFRDAAGRVVERRQNSWTETYVVQRVVGAGPLQLATAWLGDSVQQVITGFIGAALLRVGASARTALRRRGGKQPG